MVLRKYDKRALFVLHVCVTYSTISAIQVIPELRKVASHVYSYQRTPAWVVPRGKDEVKMVFLTDD